MRRLCFGANGKNSDPPWCFKPDDQRILRREDKATIQNRRLGIAMQERTSTRDMLYNVRHIQHRKNAQGPIIASLHLLVCVPLRVRCCVDGCFCMSLPPACHTRSANEHPVVGRTTLLYRPSTLFFSTLLFDTLLSNTRLGN